MAGKRIRTPSHFIAGIGDGKVRDPRLQAPEGRSGLRQNAEQQQVRRSRRHDLYQDDQRDMYLKSRDHGRPADPWQFSAFALLASVVLLSALFLHLISDTSEQKSKRRRHRPVRIDKKIDVWNDDEEEGGGGGRQKNESSAAAPRPPQVYYHPYQPRLQQRVPQRSSMNMPAVRSAQATAVVKNSPQPPPPQPAQPDLFATGSYYMHPSGGALFANNNNNNPNTNTSASRPRLPSASPKASPNPARAEQASPHAVRRSLKAEVQATTPRAVALESRISSFGSLTGPHSGGHDDDEEKGTPKRPVHDSVHSTILLSPGTEDVDETLRLTEKTTKRLVIPDLAEDTPRAANGRQLFHAPRPGELQWDGLQKPSSSSSMAFASPPKMKNSNYDDERHMDPYAIPFVPSLGARGHAPPPPMSVNVDALHLHQMESGNVSHWEARVAEESLILQERVFSGTHAELEDPKIPSDDPRCHIDHKRLNITHDTNSTKALQGAIEFSKLELEEVIGGGGFGQVWRAKWRGTPVAVKVLTGSAQAKHVPKAVLEEFAAEINLLKGMQHPNICLYMGACVDPPNRAIVTELAANGSLWDALRLPLKDPFVACDGKTQVGWPMYLYQPDARHGAPPGQRSMIVPPKYTWHWVLVKKVAIGMARGMAYLHGGEPPVLHRDLKSANILLDESYNPKVCDFGLSRLKAQERSMTGNCGTVQWMAPEVLANQAYNEKADVFSYGIICWELLSRQCPYEGMTAIQCALAVLNRNQRPEIPKWCPPALHAVIRSCLKKNPDERPSFEALIQAFDAMPDE